MSPVELPSGIEEFYEKPDSNGESVLQTPSSCYVNPTWLSRCNISADRRGMVWTEAQSPLDWYYDGYYDEMRKSSV